METNKKYRPPSYSEGYIDKFNYVDNKLKLLDISNFESDEINIKIIPNNNKKNYLYYFYKRLLSFTFHLLLIAFFEIIFFFSVIVKYENIALYNMADSYINPIINYCQNLNQLDRTYFFDIFNLFFNSTIINSLANQDYVTRNDYNNSIILLSWIYVLIIFLIFIFLIAFNQFYLKIKINYKKILIDNFFMIILLGVYEYMFFNTIIIKYKNIDSSTLNQYLVNKINSC